MSVTVLSGLGFSLITGATSVAAQTTEAEPAADPTTEVIVRAARDMAGVRQKKSSSTAFGLEKDLVDTPRAVTVISDKLLSRYNIKTVYDFTSVSAGTYTGSFFGVPGSLNIRGTMADNYFNGFQGLSNFANFPTPVDATSNIEIVRGPASPVYGAGQVGGFMNFIPKTGYGESTKYVEKFEGEVTATLGSYNEKEATLNLAAPLNLGGNKGGIHFYGKLQDSDSFYLGMHPKSQVFQLSYATDLGSDWSFDSSYQYIHSDGYLKNIGWNRATQQLVDDGLYISGSPSVKIVADGADSITKAQYYGATGGGDLLFYAPAFGLNTSPTTTTTLDPATVKLVKLSPRQTFIDEGVDLNVATTHTLYMGLSRTFSFGQLKVENFLNTLDSQNYQSYGFGTSFNSYVVEQRVSLHSSGDWGPVHWQQTSGISNRYTKGHTLGSLNDFVLSEDRRDLSVGATADDRFNNPFTTANFVWATDIHSTVKNQAIFALADLTWGAFSLTAGGRVDKYDVEALNSGGEVAGIYNTRKASDTPASYSTSLSYKTRWFTAYATYAQSKALQLDQGGSISPTLILSGAYLGASKLKEVGIKTSQLGGRFYAALDTYDQVRSYLSAPPTGATTVSAQRGRGVELEMRYLVTQSFGLTSTATWQKTKQLPTGGAGLFITVPSYLTAAGIDGYGGYTFTNTNRIPELQNGFYLHSSPDFNGSLFATYDKKGLWGATGGFTYASATGGFMPGAIRLPAYTLVKLGAYVIKGPYRVDLNIDNLLDERYFLANTDTDANANFLPGIGRQFHVKLSRSF
jgi:iron complex outermembrane receptor protein